MRRITVLCAAAIALSAAAMVGPAQAAAYHLIRWDNTGVCQVWNDAWTMKPIRWPSDYKVVGKPIPTFMDAMAVKEEMLQHGTCRW